MVKLFGPLHSDQASGTVAKAVTFSHRNGRAYAKCHAAPKTPPTSDQITHRHRVARLGDAWAKADASQKATWAPPAAAARLPTFAYFTAHNWLRIKNARLPVITYDPTWEYLHDTLLLYVPFDERGGTSIRNIVSGNTGTLQNADLQTAWFANVPAITLDGIDDRIDTTTLPPLIPTQPFTMTATAAISAEAHNQFLFCVHEPGNANNALAMHRSTAGILTFSWLANSGVNLYGYTTQAVPVDTQCHLAITYDGSIDNAGLRLYIDGTDYTANYPGTPTDLKSATGAWSWGGRIYDNTRNLNARVYNLAIWPHTLTPAEIAALQTNPLCPINIH